jgi:putative tryptophan/tyrosine transport system substrate-binding protein
MIVGMGRREFLAGLVGAAWPLAALAQQAGKVPTIGLLSTDETFMRPMANAFVQRLGELGWVEGQTVEIDYRWSEGNPERAAAFAAEFVHMKVDVIVTSGIAAAIVKRTTSDIPIVFSAANDPIGGGLVTNLARPGGNITGLSNQASDLAGKRLELLREVVRNLHTLAVLVDVGFAQSALEMDEVKAAARKFGIDLTPLEIRQAQDIAPAFATLKAPADALYVVGDSLLNANATAIVMLALGARLPTIFNNRSFVGPGGLMSYGPNIVDQYRRAADYVDKILRGAKPGDLPVEQPTKFELVINLKAAKALGLAIPTTLLATADEVIE